MKETLGELNTTVIVMIAVGVFMAFFFYFIWPALRGNWQRESDCKNAVCECSEDKRVDDGKYCLCHAKDNESNTFKCIFKG